jgi:pSer/pThr/pTyr-binding forkhead associated (FHA) protein
MALAAALMVLAAGAVVVVRALGKRRAKRAAARQAELDRRKAALQILEGVGRGRLVPIESAIFRIGAASSSKAEERNDLVLNDQDGTVSRYHCSVARKGGDYFLIDSSSNGTFLNDGMLAQGTHHRLEDGDEITISDVARLKFVLA